MKQEKARQAAPSGEHPASDALDRTEPLEPLVASCIWRRSNPFVAD